MKKLLIAGVALAALIGTPALAADMEVKVPLPPAPVFSWSGCYLGGNAGGAVSHVTTTDTLGTTGTGVAQYQANGSPTMDSIGVTVGGQIGCNWQVNRVVFGIEADGEYLDLSGNASSSILIPGGGTPLVTNLATELTHALFTVRPRLGLAVDRALLYVTGGFAEGNVSYADAQVVSNMLLPTIGLPAQSISTSILGPLASLL